MALHLEFLPPGVPAEQAQEVVFTGVREDLDQLTDGIYALEARRRQALAEGTPFAVSQEQMSMARREWSEANSGSTVTVSIGTGTIAARGAVLLDAQNTGARHLSGEATTHAPSARQERQSRIAAAVGPFLGIIEAENRNVWTTHLNQG